MEYDIFGPGFGLELPFEFWYVASGQYHDLWACIIYFISKP